jgi:hypothetical protein
MDCGLTNLQADRRMTPRKITTPAMQLLRVMAMVGIFIGAGLLFWKQYESSLNRIQSRQSIWDQTQTLSQSQKQFLYDFAGRLKKDFGIDLIVKITKEKTAIPDLDKKTIFIGLCPPRRQATVVFPPLARRAVGEEFISHLQNTHFRPYWPDKWPQGLEKSLVLIREKLAAVGS